MQIIVVLAGQSAGIYLNVSVKCIFVDLWVFPPLICCCDFFLRPSKTGFAIPNVTTRNVCMMVLTVRNHCSIAIPTTESTARFTTMMETVTKVATTLNVTGTAWTVTKVSMKQTIQLEIFDTLSVSIVSSLVYTQFFRNGNWCKALSKTQCESFKIDKVLWFLIGMIRRRKMTFS